MENPFISVVIPAFNEQDRIGDTVTGIMAYLDQKPFTWEILVIDDGSNDKTYQVIDEISSGTEVSVNILSIQHGGKGWAVKNGMLAARGEYRFMADADMAMPVDQIDRFLKFIEEGYDIVIGSRQMAGSRRFSEPRSRHLMGRIFNWIVQILAIKGFQDTQCGFKCFNAKTAEVLFGLLYTKGFGFDVELLYLADKLNLSVLEIPIDWYHQRSSKVRPVQDSILMVKDIVGIRIRDLFGFYSY